MKTRRGTIFMIVLGVLMCVAVVVLGATIWFFASVFESSSSDEATAAREFDEVRRRFGTVRPILEIRDGNPVLTRKPPETTSTQQLQRMHILTWEPEDGTISRITLPWWLLRMKGSSFDLQAESGSGLATTVNVSPEEIERYGPTLLLEHSEPDGRRVLAWTE